MSRVRLIFLILLWLAGVPSLFASDPDSLVDYWSSVSSSSPEYPFAQHNLAAHFLSLNTVRSRQKAENHIRQAIAKDPSAIEHHVLLMKIQYERGFYWAANETAEHILDMPAVAGSSYNESIAEAYYYMGLMVERSALKYRDMVSFAEDNVIYLTSYGQEDMVKAADCFEKAIQHNRQHRDAAFHLGQLYFEVQNYERMKSLFEHALRLDPNDKDAYCFAAMAYYYMGRPDIAMQFYSKALTLMTKEESDVYNSVEFLLPDKERDLFVSLKEPDRDQFQKEFWNLHDPLYLTQINERQLEHYNRVTYANLRYSVPKKNLPGWRTEKGRIFIRYGKPLVSYKVQPDERILGGSENWQYDDFFFHFTDDFASGHYLLDDQSLLTERSVFHEKTESFALPPAFSFHLLAKAFQFKGSNGETRLRVYYGADIDDIDADYSTFGLDVVSDVGLFLMNDSNRITGEKRSVVRLNRDYEEGPRFVDYVELDRLPASSGIRTYSVEVLTRMDHKAGIVREPVQIRSYAKDHLALSDVILASRITKERDLRVIPTFSNSVSRNSLVYLYFEMYHLTLNAYGNSAFQITTSFERKDGAGLLRKILPWKTQERSISSSFDVAGNRRDEEYYFALDVRDLEPGTYDLTLSVTDRLTAGSVSRVIPITITK